MSTTEPELDTEAIVIATAGSRPGTWHRSTSAFWAVARGAGCLYVVRALAHPANIIVFMSAAILAFIFSSVWMLLFAVGAEVIFLATIPRTRLFQKPVDAAQQRAERAAQARAREAVVSQLDAKHRRELTKLQALVDKTRENVASASMIVDGDGLDRLLASYIRLALSHKTATESLSLSMREPPEATIHSLQATAPPTSEDLQVLFARRLAIAQKRLESRAQAEQRLEAISHRMAAVFELVHLVHERALSPFGGPSPNDEVDGFIRELEETEAAMRQMLDVEVHAADGPIVPL